MDYQGAAKAVLVNYFWLMFQDSSLMWGDDNRVEIEEIVDNIVAAAKEAMQQEMQDKVPAEADKEAPGAGHAEPDLPSEWMWDGAPNPVVEAMARNLYVEPGSWDWVGRMVDWEGLAEAGRDRWRDKVRDALRAGMDALTERDAERMPRWLGEDVKVLQRSLKALVD